MTYAHLDSDLVCTPLVGTCPGFGLGCYLFDLNPVVLDALVYRAALDAADVCADPEWDAGAVERFDARFAAGMARIDGAVS